MACSSEPWRLDARFRALPSSVWNIRTEVTEIARRCGLHGQGLADVALAVSEAATNAATHGARGDDPYIRVTARLASGEFRVAVCDEGGGIRPRPDSHGAGLGLPVIAAVAGRLEIDTGDGGTTVRMAFPCPAAGTADRA